MSHGISFEPDRVVKGLVGKISRNFVDTSEQDPYDLSVVTYALHKAVHPDKDAAWAQLESLAQEQGDLKWWRSDIPELESENPWHGAPNTETIEMTSYALLCLTERGGISDAVPVTNWLFSQMNINGGFASTADTYTGNCGQEFETKVKQRFVNISQSLRRPY